LTTLGRLTGDTTNTLIGGFVFLITLVVYTITLTPNVPFWDGGEYIATSYILGVPHAPGTPLYVLIGRVFTLIPVGEIAQRVNWLSAFSSAVALLFVYLIAVKVTRKMYPWEENPSNRTLAYLAGVVGAFVAGFATTFWDNAIEAEVYASSCALMAFVVWLVLRWEERLDEGTEDGLLLVITYFVGLGVGIHLGVAIAAWAAVVYVFLCRPEYLTRWNYVGWAIVTLSLATGPELMGGLLRDVAGGQTQPFLLSAFVVAPAILVLTLGIWLVTGNLNRLAFWASLLFMAAVSVHFFLIIRANLDPIINEAAPKDWTALWKMLIRDQYKPPPITQRKAEWIYQADFMWLRYMWWNFSILGEKVGGSYAFRDLVRGALQPAILLSIAGAIVHFVRDRRTAFLLGILFLLLGPAMVVYLNFKVGEVRERDYFFVQNFMFMAIWVGVGAAWFADWVRRQVNSEELRRAVFVVAALALVAISVVPLFKNWDTHDRRGFLVANNYAYNMLNSLEPNSIILTNGDNDTFPLWYLQEVEEVRKDVRVVNLSLLNTDWYIEQLRDLEPRVPITYTDQQIAMLNPYQDRDGRIWLVKDIAVYHILTANKWQRPVYLAVTVPDQMGLDKQLSMEGLVFRIHPQEVKDRVNVEKTLHLLNEVYRYDGLVIQNEDGTAVRDTLVHKDDNASKLVQNYAAAHARVALNLFEEGKSKEALDQIERAELISPYFPGLVLVKGVILEQLGRFDEALDHYQNMIRVYPRDWQLSFRTGETLMQQGRVEEAISFFEHSVQLAPADQYYPYQGLASAYYQLDQYERAANVLERWLLLHPDDPNVKPIYDELVQSLQAGGTPRPDTASQPPSPPIANDD
jgi:tetratricopeptide (TPR) repeat protein/uncharacterized membrane protein YeaQ/YmgE (transglycosylase-associated protein family)